jgi:hypothetical protein
MNNELRISILFSVIVVYNLFSSLKYTKIITMFPCNTKVSLLSCVFTTHSVFFFFNINHNDGKGAFTLTLFEMTITDCPGFHVPHCT